MGGGWEGVARLPLFVLFSLFSRPGAGLATVESSCHGLATKTINERNGKNNCLEFAMMYVSVCVCVWFLKLYITALLFGPVILAILSHSH